MNHRLISTKYEPTIIDYIRNMAKSGCYDKHILNKRRKR
jgi:hypothetical protein